MKRKKRTKRTTTISSRSILIRGRKLTQKKSKGGWPWLRRKLQSQVFLGIVVLLMPPLLLECLTVKLLSEKAKMLPLLLSR